MAKEIAETYAVWSKEYCRRNSSGLATGRISRAWSPWTMSPRRFGLSWKIAIRQIAKSWMWQRPPLPMRSIVEAIYSTTQIAAPSWRVPASPVKTLLGLASSVPGSPQAAARLANIIRKWCSDDIISLWSGILEEYDSLSCNEQLRSLGI